MQPNETTPEKPPAAETVAAVDIGTNALRMVIAQVFPDGTIEPLERLQRAVRLGQDTFRRGRLGGQSMTAAVAILRDYRQLLNLYRVERVRAVATSAVREAGNADTFLDRIFIATGLNVEIIGTSEECRLTVSALLQAVGSAMEVKRDATLVVDVGGGSTLLTLLQEGEIVTSLSLRLGAIRLQEVLATSEESPQRSVELLRRNTAKILSTVQTSLPLERVTTFVAAGGDARFAAHHVGRPAAVADLAVVDAESFDRLLRRCERQAPEELVKRYGLPFAEAETLVPALIVYQTFLRKLGLKEMVVSHVSMRDGLLLEMAYEVTGQHDEALVEGIVHSAMALGEKYRADAEHARNVADLALRLFDFLRADHGLGKRQRLLLHVAALLHEVGAFVSARAHHKHSHYLIANSEIFGLNRDEIEIVAQIARYHRRSPPKPSHAEYMALSRGTRVTISKLAALLRVADALVRGHAKEVRHISIERQEDDLVVFVAGVADFLLEQRALALKADLFEDVYGMRVRLEEA